MLSVAEENPQPLRRFHEPAPAVASRALAPGCLKSHAVRRPWAQRTARRYYRLGAELRVRHKEIS